MLRQIESTLFPVLPFENLALTLKCVLTRLDKVLVRGYVCWTLCVYGIVSPPVVLVL